MKDDLGNIMSYVGTQTLFIYLFILHRKRSLAISLEMLKLLTRPIPILCAALVPESSETALCCCFLFRIYSAEAHTIRR